MAFNNDVDGSDRPSSVFQSNLPLEGKLEKARTELLDLSARNRLLNMPRSGKSAKTLEIIDEQTSEIFRLLVRQQRAMTFLAGRRTEANAETGADADDSEEIVDLAQPDDDGVDDRGVASRHADTKLQTRLTPAGLQKRLLDLYYDARTLEEEQGVNILFLALGSLKWIDPNNAANIRFAPLILIPVALERGNAAEKFKLRWRQEDPAANLSLEAYLDRIHGLKLPTFDAGDDFDPTAYVSAVAEAVAAKTDWSVQLDDITLGFFSFAKFLMYRDLDPLTWPKGSQIADHEIVRSLVSDGFDEGDPLLPEDEPVDRHIPPTSMTHIVDSDSSQTMAVYEVRRGRSLVIQGPPGTGKSQTIANIIGAAVADGKTVLFVAEKMAALEVVKRRLDNNGVGDVCLELHSNKANKRAVLEELKRTWALGAPKGEDLTTLNARLTDARDTLNAHAERLHRPIGAAGSMPYQVIGQLTRLRQAGQQPTDLLLETPEQWTAEQLHERSALVDELVERVGDIGVPAEHIWRGIGLATALPPEVSRLVTRIAAFSGQLDAMRAEQSTLAGRLEQAPPETLAALDALMTLANRIVDAPTIDPAGLGSDIWTGSLTAIDGLLAAGECLASLREELEPVYRQEAWSIDIAAARDTLTPLPASFSAAGFDHVGILAEQLGTLFEESAKLVSALGRDETPSDIRGIGDMARVAERVAAAPDADPEALGATLWDSGIERAGDLADRVATLEDARSTIGNGLSDTAWSVDLVNARQVLAGQGTSLFRFFDGEWRAANRLVRSYLADPKIPLGRQLELLDALARGRSAIEEIKREDEFGHNAFSSAWRGERSDSAPLLAIVEWMRSLKGLGAEPRLVAGRRPDRVLLARLSTVIVAQIGSLRQALSGLWEECGPAREGFFADAPNWDQADLAIVQAAASKLQKADALDAKFRQGATPDLETRRGQLANLAKGQALATQLDDDEAIGKKAFGSDWSGATSEWPTLRAAADWVTGNPDIHQLAARIVDRLPLCDNVASALAERDTFVAGMENLLGDLRAGDDALVAPGAVVRLPIAALAVSLVAWRDESELLSKWVAYRSRSERANALGLKEVVARLHSGRLTPDRARLEFEMAYFEAVFADQVGQEPALAEFDGDLHNRVVQNFADLDRQRIRQSALEVVRAHHSRIPPSTGGKVGPLGYLKGQMALRRGHKPIRALMHQAAPAIQALKPVFMMSPLSVAQYLEPGAISFDLLVMDEASQIQPVDALGAIARCKQVVVVGDPQQLPPTSFFSKMTGNTDDDDDGIDGAQVGQIESILGLFTARGLPMRMLRWHYRSRHESLIAVSNQQFYENKLFIVPSPFTAQAGLGLRFHHVTDGIFETGSTRTNPVEAKVVAQAIVAHAIAHPEQSLGVVAFSVAQRRAILDQLELMRRALPPEHEAFFQSHPAEPFFIKNLENVQGDERDVIFISVGYGPTAPGLKPPMRFGPLGQEGGERRLNVLISRAKRRTEIFASMTDEDIEQEFASHRKGVFAFKMFMHFARTGKMTLAEATARDHDSVFEAQVAEALHARGYQVHRQVGLAGFFIDLAIADPDHADRYLLGIECDGAGYHEARSARDRDRLRQAILEDHGWIIHRVWSTDWFRRPTAELGRVVTAIEAAKAELTARGERERQRQSVKLEVISVDREFVTEMDLVVTEAPDVVSVPYVEASLARPSHLVCDLHEAPRGLLTQMAEQVVAIEGPVHIDEIINRVRDAWGLKRAGGRIQDAVESAVDVAVRMHRLAEDGDFYSVPNSEPLVRDRSSARSPSLRKPETLPPAEIRVALADVIARNFGATEDQVVHAVSRAFGFKSTSGQLRDALTTVLNAMLTRQELIRRDSLIALGPNAPAKATPAPEPTPLEKLIGSGETEAVEFKQTLRWDVRQQAVNKKLEDVVVKTVAALGNHAGGTLLIGVCDDGTVPGIGDDLATFAQSRDKMELHLTNLLNAHFPTGFRATKVRVTFPSIDAVTICRLDVERSRQPLFVTIPDGHGHRSERFFVRSGNASLEILPSQVPAFVRERFESQ